MAFGDQRTPLGPGAKSLARGSTFAAKPKPLRRRKRTRSRPTDEQIEAKADATCWLAQFSEWPCSGVIRLCHLIRKERLRFYGVPELAIWDDRVLVYGCDGHHTQLDDEPHDPLEVPRDSLPADVEEYVADWHLAFLLDRVYGTADDVQTSPSIQWPTTQGTDHPNKGAITHDR